MRRIGFVLCVLSAASGAWAQTDPGTLFTSWIDWPDYALVQPTYGTIKLTVAVNGTVGPPGNSTTIAAQITRTETLGPVAAAKAVFSLSGTVTISDGEDDENGNPCTHTVNAIVSVNDTQAGYDGNYQTIVSDQLGIARFAISDLNYSAFNFSISDSGCNPYPSISGNENTKDDTGRVFEVGAALFTSGLQYVQVPYYSNQQTDFGAAVQAAEASGVNALGILTEAGWDGNQSTGGYTVPIRNGVIVPVYNLQHPNPSQPPYPGTLSVSWLLSGTPIPETPPPPPVPPDNTPDTDCHATGSDINCQGQSLGENIPISGTPFFLRYSSDRVMANMNADPLVVADAATLGGWTLSIHHLMEPQFLKWCVGGGCTPNSAVPKAVFLGDGSTRSAANVQTPVAMFGGNVAITSQNGQEVYIFSSKGAHLETVRPMTGAVVYTFGYDAAGALISVTDGFGNTTEIRRDGFENPTAIVAPYGQTTTLTVDLNGYLSSVTDPAGNTIQLVHDPTGLLDSMTDANGNLYTFQYDPTGQLLMDSDPAGGSTTLAGTGAASGYGVTKTTALGITTNFNLGFAATPGSSTTEAAANTFPNGLQGTSMVVQSAGQITQNYSEPDGSLYSSTSSPDPRWGIQVPVNSSETIALGNITMNTSGSRTVSLSKTGIAPFNLASQIDSSTVNGRTYTSTFTASDMTYKNVSPAGRKLQVTLNGQEQTASTQAGTYLATNFDYDDHGRLATVTQGTRTSTFGYDAKGYLSSLKNSEGTSSFTYDPNGHPLKVTFFDGRTINYTWDGNGNRTSVTTPTGQTHQLSYTPINLVATYTPPAVPGTGATSYTYDVDRHLTGVARPDGKTVNYTYDFAGRLSSMATPFTTINYTFDPVAGHLLNAAIPGGEQVSYTYLGAFPTSETWQGQVAGSVATTYENDFWVASLALNGGAPVNFTYDKDGLVTSAGAMTLTRDPNSGAVTGTKLGALTDTWTYDTYGELTGYTASASGTALYTAAFTIGALGRIASLKETIGKTTNTFDYTYDTADRLSKVAETGSTTATYSYTFDSNSNPQSVTTPAGTFTGTYDAQDRMLSYGKASFTYGANGELAGQVNGTQTTSYSYDALGNLTAATLPDGTALSYVVDPKNRRVGVTVNGVLTTGFLYNGNQIVAQLDGNNNIVSQFVYATRRNIPDYMVNGGVTYRIFSDQIGSPRMVVNSSTGAIVEQIEYDAFGNILSDTKPGFQPFGFAGGLYDQHTALLRFGARDYMPAVGRWTAKDPAGFAAGDTNLYAYSFNDPQNKVDPLGLCPTLQEIEDAASKWLSDKTSTPPTISAGIVNVDLNNGTVSTGSSVNLNVGDTTIVNVGATVGAGIDTTPDPTTIGSFFASLSASIPALSDWPLIGQYFSNSVTATATVKISDAQVHNETDWAKVCPESASGDCQ